MIPFNKPFLSGKEVNYITKAVESGKISGDGMFTNYCHSFFEKRYNFKKVLLTTSCTDALEMAAILCDIAPGDEVIAASYSFVSTVNPFILRGAKVVFCDVRHDHPCINVAEIEGLITNKTKAVVITHYAGIACDMSALKLLSEKYKFFLVEDAAHAIDAYFMEQPLGSFGHFAAFSFHETKNIIAGEGGMLVINDESYIERAEIIREKGTDRSKFFRGETDKYTWVDIGSSFLPSDIVAAFLFAQLENMDNIQKKRKYVWNRYFNELFFLQGLDKLRLPELPSYASNNAHLFYLVTKNMDERNRLIQFLKEAGIMAIFHYVPLHTSPFYLKNAGPVFLPNTDIYAENLLRLPLFYNITDTEIDLIIKKIKQFYAV